MPQHYSVRVTHIPLFVYEVVVEEIAEQVPGEAYPAKRRVELIREENGDQSYLRILEFSVVSKELAKLLFVGFEAYCVVKMILSVSVLNFYICPEGNL